MGTAINHPVPDRVKPSFIIFGIRISELSVLECPDVKHDKLRFNPFWHMVIYSCTHAETVGVKGLTELLFYFRVLPAK